MTDDPHRQRFVRLGVEPLDERALPSGTACSVLFDDGADLPPAAVSYFASHAGRLAITRHLSTMMGLPPDAPPDQWLPPVLFATVLAHEGIAVSIVESPDGPQGTGYLILNSPEFSLREPLIGADLGLAREVVAAFEMSNRSMREAYGEGWARDVLTELIQVIAPMLSPVRIGADHPTKGDPPAAVFVESSVPDSAIAVTDDGLSARSESANVTETDGTIEAEPPHPQPGLMPEHPSPGEDWPIPDMCPSVEVPELSRQGVQASRIELSWYSVDVSSVIPPSTLDSWDDAPTADLTRFADEVARFLADLEAGWSPTGSTLSLRRFAEVSFVTAAAVAVAYKYRNRLRELGEATYDRLSRAGRYAVE